MPLASELSFWPQFLYVLSIILEAQITSNGFRTVFELKIKWKAQNLFQCKNKVPTNLGLKYHILERQTNQIIFDDHVPVREEVLNGFLTTQIRKKGFSQRDENDS